MSAFDWSRPHKTKSGLDIVLSGDLPHDKFGPFNRVGIVVGKPGSGEPDQLTRWHDSGANIEKREWSLVNVPREFVMTAFVCRESPRRVALGVDPISLWLFDGACTQMPGGYTEKMELTIIARHTFTVKEGEFSA